MHERDRRLADIWVEVVEPLADAMRLLASAIQTTPGDLAGVSIAVSERETLLLNHRAWVVFGESLKALHRLKTRHATRDEVKPIRFLLIAADQVATEVGA